MRTEDQAGVGALSLRAMTPLGKGVRLSALGGVFADTEGKLSARDVQVRAPLRVVEGPSLSVQVAPGVSLPLGSATAGLEYTLLTTGSFDPTLAVDVAAGGAWVGLFGGSVRLPLHPGFDRIRQGVYAYGAARIARRIGGGAVSAGLSMAGQQQRGLTSPGFVELAAIAGGTAPLSKTWALDVNARVPVWAGKGGTRYYGALQVGATHVFGKAKPEPH